MTDTTPGTTDDTPTLPTSASSSPSPGLLEQEFSAALARLVPNVSGILPDDVVHMYVHLGRTEVRLKKFVSMSKRKIAANRRTIDKRLTTIAVAKIDIERLDREIDQKQQEVQRYQESLSGTKTLRRLVEEGKFALKGPRIFGRRQDADH